MSEADAQGLPRDARIFVAGHRGMVGAALLRRLRAAGCTRLLVREHRELDLTRQAETEAFSAPSGPSTYSLPQRASAASSPTTRSRRISSATIC